MRFLQVNMIHDTVEFGAEMGKFPVCGHTHLSLARECLIGASLSEPHTCDEYASTVCMCIYIYMPYVLPYSSGAEGFQGRTMRTKQG